MDKISLEHRDVMRMNDNHFHHTHHASFYGLTDFEYNYLMNHDKWEWK